MDIIEKCGITAQDMKTVTFLLVRNILSGGKDQDPESNREKWETLYHLSLLGAELGDGSSMSWLADMYYGRKVTETEDCPDNVAEAKRWWEKGAEAGNGRCATNLGLLYLNKPIPGSGDHGTLPYDEKKALQYFLKGYELGDSKAGRHVGLCYKNGIGVDRSDTEAYEWYKRAAEKGDSSAQLYCADCLLKGDGCKQDVYAAIRQYEKLVSVKGHDITTAAYALACIYRDGEYAPKDEELSDKYFRIVVETATKHERELAEEAKRALGE